MPRHITKTSFKKGFHPKTEFKSEEQIGSLNFNYKGGDIRKICSVCGNEFYIKRARESKKNAGRYCSRKCLGVSKGKTTVTVNCIVCNKEIKIIKSRQKRERHFCSHKCRGVYLFKNESFGVKMMKACQRNIQTRPEKIVEEIIKKLNLPYKYTGCRSFFIENFNPDFININGQGKIIEINGDYWHKSDRAKEKDKRKIAIFKSYGYDTLVLWEGEIKNNIDDVKNKIVLFNQEK